MPTASAIQHIPQPLGPEQHQKPQNIAPRAASLTIPSESLKAALA